MVHSTSESATPYARIIRAFGMSVLALAVLIGIQSPASAQRLCLSHDDIMELLDTRYSEARVAAGVASGGKLIEVFSTGDGGTWTIVITSPGGTSCIMATGEAWHAKEQVALGPQA